MTIVEPGSRSVIVRPVVRGAGGNGGCWGLGGVESLDRVPKLPILKSDS